MDEKILLIYLQTAGDDLHPISRKILSTGLSLAAEKGYGAEGVVFAPCLTEALKKNLKALGLFKITVFEGADGFCPERESEAIKGLGKPEILLFPATPEGRAVSSMTAALFHTGVTADCTALSFTKDGNLLQTRPAFSGGRLASIVTANTRPQIASLRFSMPVSIPNQKTELVLKTLSGAPPCTLRWTERLEAARREEQVILCVGGGLQSREDAQAAQQLARQLGIGFGCSRALVDRQWLPKSCQIGLSGREVSCDLLICLGVSGSQQFLAGIQEVKKLLAVDVNPLTPLMKRADMPIQCDLYQVLKALEA